MAATLPTTGAAIHALDDDSLPLLFCAEVSGEGVAVNGLLPPGVKNRGGAS
jgi:hypothetical protein